MSIVVNFIILAFIALGTLAGFKRGLIKSLVNFIGLLAVIIISYALKTSLANFLIDKMPFFNFGGTLEGLTSINILIYNILAFIVVFIVLYCILNIIIAVTGFIDTLLKFTVIWVIPSKIGGAIVGFFESWVFIFLVLFVLTQFTITNAFIKNSSVANIILDHTPIVGTFLGDARDAATEIYAGIEEFRKDESKTANDLDLYILQVEINYGLISKEKATELMETGKVGLKGVMFGKGENLWLNI